MAMHRFRNGVKRIEVAAQESLRPDLDGKFPSTTPA